MKKIILCSPRGFCAGVIRAIKTVEEALIKWKCPIYVKHHIVHNMHVVKELEKKGAIFIEDLSKIPKNSKIIYSAHGVSPEVRLEAKKRKLFEIDATCPLVTKLHSATKRYSKKGYKIIIMGKKNHIEVIGTFNEAPEDTTIISKVSDIDNLNFSKDQKLFYFSQTTLSVDDVKPIREKLLAKFPQIEYFSSSSICYATQNRQNALINVLNEVDLVLVVGDRRSSNSTRLKEIAQKRSKMAYLINYAMEIAPEWLKDITSIAITSGASTPETVVLECILRLKEFGFDDISERCFIEENKIFEIPKILQQ